MNSLPKVAGLLFMTLAASGQAAAQSNANCALANVLDVESYRALTMPDPSAVSGDQTYLAWADCRASKLDASLKKMPQLQYRIALFRKQYTELRSLENYFASVRGGGGTAFTHNLPRSLPHLEEQLSSLAQLAGSKTGALSSPVMAQQVNTSKESLAQYLKRLKAYRPQDDKQTFDSKEWAAKIDRYGQVSTALMLTLGSKGDAATAMGYFIMTDRLFLTDENG